MSERMYAVPMHYTTRQINAAIRRAIARAIADNKPCLVGGPVTHNVERRRQFGRVDYVHGMGNYLRDTWLATYNKDTHTVRICVPNNYRGWNHPSTDQYTRARIKACDYIRTYLNLALLREHEVSQIEAYLSALHPINRVKVGA
jgi:hypothetical protein